MEQSLDHGIERIYPILFDQFTSICLSPGVEELIGCEKRTSFIVHPVTDHTECIVLEKLWNITFVAHRQLNKGIVDRRLLTDRALELEHHQRQTIDVENAIRYPFLVADDLQLIHHFEDVATCFVNRLFLRHNQRYLSYLRFPKLHQI